MRIHPSILALAGRLWRYTPVAFCAALLSFVITRARDAYPGASAAWICEVAGLESQGTGAHPLFILFARWFSGGSDASLISRLNLFSALCGAGCATLLFLLVGRLILFSACEDGDGQGRSGLTDETEEDTETALALPLEVQSYNRRMLRISILGGFTAVFLLLFLAASWSASTRLSPGMFHLLIALLIFLVYPFVGSRWKLTRLSLTVFLCVVGTLDSSAFLFLVPILAVLLFLSFVESKARGTLILMSALAAMAGLALFGFAYRTLASDPSLPTAAALRAMIRGVAQQRLGEWRTFFPATGWLLVLVQVGVPAALLLFGRTLLFGERRPNTLLAILMIVAASLQTLLNLPFSPFLFFEATGHLPVFTAAVQACAVACALASCLVLLSPDDQRAEVDLSLKLDYKLERYRQVQRGLAGCLLPVLLLLMLVAPFRSWRWVNPSRGAFADCLAKEILDALGKRTCLVSDGLLTHHLKLQAHLSARPLTIITVRSTLTPLEKRDLKRFIAGSPLFEGLNRQRLDNALSISAERFVTEWFAAAPQVVRQVMVLGLPELWTAGGFVAVPEGLAFSGHSKADALPQLDAMDARHRAFVARVKPDLAGRRNERGPVAWLRAVMRIKAGFAANEWGVLLEDHGQVALSYEAYERAAALDPDNVSALINAYALALLRNIRPETAEALNKQVKRALARNRVNDLRAMVWVLQNHGTVRQQAFYAQQTALWSQRGLKEVASEKLRRAKTLAEHTGTAALMDQASVFLQSGDLQSAEASYRAVVGKEAKNGQALVGLCTVALAQGQKKEAQSWLSQAQAAGVEPKDLRYQAISLALMNGEDDRVRTLLAEAAKETPGDPRYWALQAEVLLKQGDLQLVERQLLPNMQAALKSPDHYLIHAVKGMVLRRKGPEFFREARQSLLEALSLNAALSDVWDELLELDLAIGNSVFIESDARKQLSMDPDHPLANYLLGALLLSRGKLSAAEDFLRRSIERKPTSSACNDLAECLRLQKRHAEAETLARQALVLDPNLAPAQDTLANILCDVGRFPEADSLVRPIVQRYPDAHVYHLTLLRAEIGLRKKAEALQRSDLLRKAGFEIPKEVLKQLELL